MVPCWFRKGELHDLHAIIDIDHIYPFELHPPKILFSYDIQQRHLCDNLEVLNIVGCGIIVFLCTNVHRMNVLSHNKALSAWKTNKKIRLVIMLLFNDAFNCLSQTIYNQK